MRLAYSVILALAGTTSVSIAQENLLCLGEKSTGFHWNGSSWDATTFNVTDARYVVKPVAEYEYVDGNKVNYEITRLGESFSAHKCFRGMYNGAAVDQIACGGLGFGFIVNFKTLRFQEVYTLGFVDGSDAGGNTPSLTIGRCSPF